LCGWRPAKRMISYAMPAISGRQDPRQDQPVPLGGPKTRTRRSRSPSYRQERRPQRVDAGCGAEPSGSSGSSRLVGVDRLVLGRVVLEDAPRSGQSEMRRGRR
jgi:hypothetical protein